MFPCYFVISKLSFPFPFKDKNKCLFNIYLDVDSITCKIHHVYGLMIILKLQIHKDVNIYLIYLFDWKVLKGDSIAPISMEYKDKKFHYS